MIVISGKNVITIVLHCASSAKNAVESFISRSYQKMLYFQATYGTLYNVFDVTIAKIFIKKLEYLQYFSLKS